MSAYRTIIVGTDGSESSLRAVDRAGAIAGDANAQLVLACAYHPAGLQETSGAEDLLKGDGWEVHGGAPVFSMLHEARERATAAGARNVDERAVIGSASAGLLSLAKEMAADLLVVGNRGLNTVSGRFLGSLPAEVARKSACDVLVVHTIG
jgi:nucleotide-binding universal stress UspA family protein